MLAAFGGAHKGALARGIAGILEQSREFFVFHARFFPFVSIVKNFSAPILKIGRGVWEFFAELLIETRKRERGILAPSDMGHL